MVAQARNAPDPQGTADRRGLAHPCLAPGPWAQATLLLALSWLLASCSSLLPAPGGAGIPLPQPPLPPREALAPGDTAPQPPDLARATPLAAVAFRSGLASLDAASAASLAALAPSLPASPVLIVGRASPWGGPEFARLLSTSRANAVRIALIEAGADPAQLHVAGLGPESPPQIPLALLASPPDMATILLLPTP